MVLKTFYKCAPKAMRVDWQVWVHWAITGRCRTHGALRSGGRKSGSGTLSGSQFRPARRSCPRWLSFAVPAFLPPVFRPTSAAPATQCARQTLLAVQRHHCSVEQVRERSHIAMLYRLDPRLLSEYAIMLRWPCRGRRSTMKGGCYTSGKCPRLPLRVRNYVT